MLHFTDLRVYLNKNVKNNNMYCLSCDEKLGNKIGKFENN